MRTEWCDSLRMLSDCSGTASPSTAGDFGERTYSSFLDQRILEVSIVEFRDEVQLVRSQIA